MSAKVIKITEADSSILFRLKDYLIGDKKGKWIVISEDVIVGRHLNEENAELHAEALNAPSNLELQNLTTKELIEKCQNLIKEIDKRNRQI